MPKYLYILCEGELDEMFYERIAERVTDGPFRVTRSFECVTVQTGKRPWLQLVC